MLSDEGMNRASDVARIALKIRTPSSRLVFQPSPLSPRHRQVDEHGTAVE
jgi:hypothetical protein